MYTWCDYSEEYSSITDSWLDSQAKHFTGCDDGFQDYYDYWKKESGIELNVNFWVKIIKLYEKPVGIIALFFYDDVLSVSEFIIAPQMRNKGIGTNVLKELLRDSQEIIGIKVNKANAVIYPDNIGSQKAFERAGFVFSHAHLDGDALYFAYDSP